MTQMAQTAYSSIDAEEVEQFSRIAEEWWDEGGKFKPLHAINPVRIGYIKAQICAAYGRDFDAISALEGLSLLDIGCGGGLIAEPMARMGAQVTGVDASERNIKTAALHAEQSGLRIDYRTTTAEALVSQHAQYDVVLALEIIEHVADAQAFIDSCCALVKPGGLLIMSTLNRTAKSFAMAIVGAEYILRMLPRGTHSWKKFLRPSEIATGFERNGFGVHDMTGMVMHPISWQWKLNPHDLDVNYLMVGKR